MSIFSNPFMKWGVVPGALGAVGGAAYSPYQGTTYQTGATLGALGGIALASPGALTSRARRDYAMYAATTKAMGISPSITGYSKALGRL